MNKKEIRSLLSEAVEKWNGKNERTDAYVYNSINLAFQLGLKHVKEAIDENERQVRKHQEEILTLNDEAKKDIEEKTGIMSFQELIKYNG